MIKNEKTPTELFNEMRDKKIRVDREARIKAEEMRLSYQQWLGSYLEIDWILA